MVVLNILHNVCNKILKTRIWPEDWITSILIPIPKKVSYNCADQRAIALISRASKVMLKILQKQIVPMAESALVDCQVVFRAGRSTGEQVTNIRILCKKYIELDWKVSLNFIDYKKGFDRVRHNPLWAALRNMEYLSTS